MTTDQVTFTEAELLADHTMAEPLIAGGVRCHGGFDDDGSYVSPRTKFRVPGIEVGKAGAIMGVHRKLARVQLPRSRCELAVELAPRLPRVA